jgi:hypothetical protein
MGRLILSRVVQGLLDAQIPAQRGYPTGMRRIITEPVCAVNLHSADVRSKQIRVLVQVLSPAELGGPLCEEMALQTGEVLKALGGTASVGALEFDGRAGLFRIEVLGEFLEEKPKVFQGETELTHVVAFSSWRTLDDEVTNWADAKWNFKLEEYYPIGDNEESNPYGEFRLVHVCESGSETYTGCTWTYQRRVWDASGFRQILIGQADLMDSG